MVLRRGCAPVARYRRRMSDRAPQVFLVRADNPGPLTLEGTNTWLVGRDPCWIVDPGPALPGHLAAVAAAASARGGAAGIVLTHDHGDHADGVPDLVVRLGGDVTVAAARYPLATRRLAGGDVAGPFTVIATPGHAPDHLAFHCGTTLFSGDAVLGRGSVFVAPYPGAMGGYLRALEHLLTLELEQICPGHGPVVDDPGARLRHYIDHRLDRERRLLAALDRGLRSSAELVADVWSDVPDTLRGTATVTLAAHLDKLADEQRLPAGVERPAFSM